MSTGTLLLLGMGAVLGLCVAIDIAVDWAIDRLTNRQK